MTAVSVLPVSGDVLFDARDSGRSLRISWHPVDDLCVLSVWRGGRCAATFQLDRADVPELITALVEGLVQRPAAPWTSATYNSPPAGRPRPGPGPGRTWRDPAASGRPQPTRLH